jgi:hypothetical protein
MFFPRVDTTPGGGEMSRALIQGDEEKPTTVEKDFNHGLYFLEILSFILLAS